MITIDPTLAMPQFFRLTPEPVYYWADPSKVIDIKWSLQTTVDGNPTATAPIDETEQEKAARIANTTFGLRVNYYGDGIESPPTAEVWTTATIDEFGFFATASFSLPEQPADLGLLTYNIRPFQPPALENDFFTALAELIGPQAVGVYTYTPGRVIATNPQGFYPETEDPAVEIICQLNTTDQLTTKKTRTNTTQSFILTAAEFGFIAQIIDDEDNVITDILTALVTQNAAGAVVRLYAPPFITSERTNIEWPAAPNTTDWPDLDQNRPGGPSTPDWPTFRVDCPIIDPEAPM